VRILQPLAALLAGLVFATPAGASVLKVPHDFSTVQAAINAAAPGDTVLVAPGKYFENIDFLGKRITVTSKKGPKKTILDGQQAGPVVTFVSGEGPASILNGFTVRNGFAAPGPPASGNGGGIRMSGASPTITSNIISSNQACEGAGIFTYGGSPLIQGNVIQGNFQSASCSGGSGGGGILLLGGALARVTENVISGNTLTDAFGGGGISVFGHASLTIERNVISGNTARCGGGISVANTSDTLIVGNLITNNLSSLCGGGIALSYGNQVINNTIADNDSVKGSGISMSVATVINNVVVAKPGQTAVLCEVNFDSSTFAFNDVFSPSGQRYGGVCGDQTGLNGNISADPLFVDQSGGDYHIRPGSPAVDAGTNGFPLLPTRDLDGDPRPLDGDGNGSAIIDMGADELNRGPAGTDVSGQLSVGGNPLVGAHVTLKNTSTHATLTRTTDDAGAYVFDPVPAGPYQLTATGIGLVSISTVSGSFRIHGQPSAGNTVKLKNTGTGGTVSRLTDANGQFSFAGVQPGSYKLSISGVAVP
jgi:nitrous oxidase accessory protein NosD